MFNKPINAGELKFPIEILTYESSIDENGLAIEDWVLHRKVKCKVANASLNGYEKVSNEGIVSNKIKLFTFRNKDELNSKIRIKFKNKFYEVDGEIDSNHDQIYKTVRGILVE